MQLSVSKYMSFSAVASGVLLYCLGSSAAEAAGPVATPPYTLSVFATGSNGNSAPDSLVLWEESVLVGYGNGVAKDGSDGKFSTIVQYSLTGKEQRSFHVQGHNDGLKLVGENSLWALQNEDANPKLVVIDLKTGIKKEFFFPPPPHGGGYDDIAVQNGRVFITASNPNLNAKGVNVFPALLEVTSLAGGKVHLEPVLEGNDPATDIPTGETVSLNLMDPDSLTVDPRHNIVLDDQADAQLVFIRDPDTKFQTVHRVNITDTTGAPTTLDDTAFAPNPHAFMLVADVGAKANTVYRIDEPSLGFEPGTAYSSSDTKGIVGQLNLDNGVITPIATGFMSTRGLIFVPPVKKDKG
jgi:hypothetical protein